MDDNQQYVEVVFRYDSPVLGEAVEEVLWASVIDEAGGEYELVSIPFYGLPLATADHFEASPDAEDGRLTYQTTVRNSGNSVVVVALTDPDQGLEALRAELETLGCRSEALNPHYFACEVPKDVLYGQVRDLLTEEEDAGLIEFAESRPSAKHQGDPRRHK